MSSRLFLKSLNSEYANVDINLSGSVSFGRSRSCNMMLEGNPMVSSKHFVIEPMPDNYPVDARLPPALGTLTNVGSNPIYFLSEGEVLTCPPKSSQWPSKPLTLFEGTQFSIAVKPDRYQGEAWAHEDEEFAKTLFIFRAFSSAEAAGIDSEKQPIIRCSSETIGEQTKVIRGSGRDGLAARGESPRVIPNSALAAKSKTMLFQIPEGHEEAGSGSSIPAAEHGGVSRDADSGLKRGMPVGGLNPGLRAKQGRTWGSHPRSFSWFKRADHELQEAAVASGTSVEELLSPASPVVKKHQASEQVAESSESSVESLLSPASPVVKKHQASEQVAESSESSDGDYRSPALAGSILKRVNQDSDGAFTSPCGTDVEELGQVSEEKEGSEKEDFEEKDSGKVDVSFQPMDLYSKGYEVLESLGRGTSGEVFRVKNKQTGLFWAAKVIRMGFCTDAWEPLREEVRVLASLKHPNIVSFKEVFQSHCQMIIVMELMSGGDLKTLYYDKKTEAMSVGQRETLFRPYFRNIVDAVCYLHDRNLLHRDIKLENIALDVPGRYASAKLCDFGLARIVSSTSLAGTYCGTQFYMAPEVHEAHRQPKGTSLYGKPADVWSLGVMLSCMLVKKGPSPHRVKFVDEWSLVSREARNLLSRVILKDPSKRLTAQQISMHPWVLGAKLAH